MLVSTSLTRQVFLNSAAGVGSDQSVKLFFYANKVSHIANSTFLSFFFHSRRDFA